MLFNSLEFIVFLPIVFAIYWLLRNHLKLQNLFVVFASYVFYGWWDYKFLLLIAFTSLCSYASGILIDRGKQKHGIPTVANQDSPSIDLQSAREQAPGQTTAQSCTADTLPDTSQKHASLTKNIKNINSAKAWMITNIVINLGILAVFKYYDFFVSEFGALFGITTDSLLLRIILPVGISFYTFQALSYSIDVYRKKIEPTRDIVAFFAFISFFPQLVAPQMLLTFVLVTIGWIIFRAPSVSDAWGYVGATTNMSGVVPTLPITQWIGIIFGLLTMIAFEWSYRNSDQAPIPHRWWIYYILIAAIWWYAPSFSTDFIYFQF